MLTLFLMACLAAAAGDEAGTPVDAAAPHSQDALTPAAPAPPAPAAPTSAPGSPAATVAQPARADDPFEGAVEVFHFGFEENEDRNFDRHPDGWIRRKGPDFPRYIEGAIDAEHGHGGKGASLCFKANGGRITMYSKPIVIDPYHSYVFRGYVRTQMLENDAALVSVSLLNHKRQRVQRFLTRPITGTFKGWSLVTIGPIVPHEDVHFVAIGCHLVPKSRSDIRGAAWFDDLWMGQLPLFSLDSNFQSHFRGHDSPVVISSHVDGLDPKRVYRLDVAVADAEGKQVAATAFDLSRKPTPSEPTATGQTGIGQTGTADKTADADKTPGAGTPAEHHSKRERPIDWTVGAQPHGFYAVEAVLSQDGKPLLTKRTSFAVMDTLSDVSDQGEFGWTIRRASDMPALKELAELASQAGINWLKYPLWESVSDSNSAAANSGSSSGGQTPTPTQISAFFEELSLRHITPVGLLNEPPRELRNQFARDWNGISELFTMRTEFWRESIEKVIARYSSHVRHWQLGEEADESFVGMSAQNLSQTVARVKGEFDRIGRDTRIGVHWNWETPPPRRSDVRGIFLSIGTRQRLKEGELVARLKSMAAADAPERWVLVKPLPKSGFTADERGSDLVKKMVEAKIGGAERIFIDDVFDEEFGLLAPGGSPSPLFLPWRTTAMALQGAEFIGSFNLPEGSRNFAFSRKGDVAIVVWSHEPVDEDLYLGEESIVTDVLGRRIHLQSSAGGVRQKIRIGPSPLVIRHFPEQIARWMAAVTFEKGRLPSKTGKQREVIKGINTFHQGVNGQVHIIVPKDWKVEPPEARFSLAAGDKFEIPITLELPSNTSLGSQRIVLDFTLPSYAFRVYRDYEVGLGDVVFSVVDTRLENGDLQIKQLIVNNTKPEERLNFECNLYISNRKRMQRIVTKLGNGRDTQVYTVPDADALRGQELQLRAQQIGGQRILNLRWKVGENWDQKGRGATAEGTPSRRRARLPEPKQLPTEPPQT
jgi:hypothetical protein